MTGQEWRRKLAWRTLRMRRFWQAMDFAREYRPEAIAALVKLWRG